MKVGDLVEIRELRPFKEIWRPAVVVHVDTHGPGKFTAQLLRGDFGEPLVNRGIFSDHDRGNTWR